MDKLKKFFTKSLMYAVTITAFGFMLWYLIAYIVLFVRVTDFFFSKLFGS